MPYHMMPSSQKAKDLVFKGGSFGNTDNKITSASNPEPTRPPPRSASRPLTPTKMMILGLCLSILLVLLVFFIMSAMSYARGPSFIGKTTHTNFRKLGKRKPPPLDLTKDLEAQPRSRRHGNSFDPNPTPTSSMSSGELDNGTVMTTGASFTPFTPARERPKSSGIEAAGGTERENMDEEDLLGLDQYFFEGGIGIKRYESRAKARRWKDE